MSGLGTARSTPPSRSLRSRATLRGSVLLLSFALLTLAGCSDANDRQQAARVCGALAEERFEEVLALSESGSSASGTGREVAECRCIAMLSLGDRNGCTELLGPLLAEDEATDWVPHIVLTKLILRTWQTEGHLTLAATLAERAVHENLADLDLLQLEVMLRSTQEDESTILRRIEERLTEDLEWLPQRLVLALGWNRRARYDDAIHVLGETAPPIDHPLALPWFESRIQAQASKGDLDAVRVTFEAWRATGWDPTDLDARYALRLSVDQLGDPETGTIELLRAALATQDRLTDRNIVWGLHRRMIQELLSAGRPAEALSAYDAAVDIVALEGITRGEIERAIRLADGTFSTDAPATFRFHGPPGLGSGRVWISPNADDPPDSGYRAHPLAEGTATEIDTRLGAHPLRWIVRDGDGKVRASGSVWPEPGETIDIHPELNPPIASNAAASSIEAPSGEGFARARRPGDGRRRVFAILADCGDWRLTEYLRARGELPFQDYMFRQGYRAVLESRPAYTAAAMQSLVWPSAAQRIGSLGWIHHLGLELAGLESVGRNPVDWLSLVLPARPNLFETLGSGPLVTANMLLAHGRIDAGRHAELVGPAGARRDLPSQNAYRLLDAAEHARHPALEHGADTRKFAETIAAEMDAAEQIVRAGEVDFLFLRLEALDLLTHTHFSSLDGAGQDDGEGPLLAAYRYIDDRLASLHALMDDDDWLVFLSDHGIRSSMQHEEDAIFVVLGDGVPPGRAPGRPSLRGVPRSLAAMFEIETNWPDTGLAPWLKRADTGPTKASLDAEIAARP